MSARRHAEASRLFAAAVNLPSDEREAYVRERAADDPDVAETVLEWLAHDTEAGGATRVAPLADALDARVEDDVPPTVGRYRLLDVLGHGGSSVVYRAVQAGLDRDVALKLMHPVPADARAVRRFELEAEILATLGHDGIAKIHEYGTYDSPFGPRPFLAMELIRGKPITDHCDEHELDRDARLVLLADTADAIHHAHQHAVIHRDIKPGNVLVDEAGAVKLLDFGIARPFDAPRGALTLDGSGPVGTLGYMSPEQVDDTWGTIDLRTDVYSLGVLAHRVLCGRMPYEFPTGSGQRPAGVDPPDLSRAGLGLDLEAVLSTAMAPSKRARYGSAADLAADLRHVLAREPVSARTPTRVERALRGVRRHPVVATVCVAGAVFFGQQQAHVAELDGYIVQLEEQSGRDDRTRRTFQIMVTDSSEASLAPLMDPEPYSHLILDRPEEYADVLVTCARALVGRAEHREHRERALEHFRDAELLRRGALGVDHPETLDVAREVVGLTVGMRRVAESWDALATLRARATPDVPARWHAHLAVQESLLHVMEGDPDAARRVLEEHADAEGGMDAAGPVVMTAWAELLAPEASIAALERVRGIYRDLATNRETPTRAKRRLQLDQKLALARLRAAVFAGDAADLAEVRSDLVFGHEGRVERYDPASRFALWGAHGVMRAAAAQEDWAGLLALAEDVEPILQERYPRADSLVVQTRAMRARALLGVGRADEARVLAEKLQRILDADTPRDRELAAHVGIVRAEVRAAAAPPDERRAILDEAHRTWAPLLVPHDERAARLLPSR